MCSGGGREFLSGGIFFLSPGLSALFALFSSVEGRNFARDKSLMLLRSDLLFAWL